MTSPIALKPAAAVPATKPAPAARAWFDLEEIWRILTRHVLLFAAMVLGTTLAALLAATLLPPTYSAASLVAIDPSGRAPGANRASAPGEPNLSELLETEMAVARSRKAAEAVVDELGLTRDPQFGGDPGRPLSRAEYDGVVDAALGNLGVWRSGGGAVMSLSYTAKDPQTAARLANAFAQQYIATSMRLRAEAAEAQARSLQGGLAKLQDAARQASATAADFRAQTGLVSASNGTVLQEEATTTASQLTAAEAKLAATRAALAEALQQKNAGYSDAVGGVLSSPVVQNLRAQRAQLMKDRDEIATRYGPRHPEYQKAEQQLEGIESQISQEMSRVIASLEAETRATTAEAGTLRARLASLQGQLAASSRTAVQAQALDREAQSKQEIYTQYDLAQQQLDQTRRTQNASAIILSLAVPPVRATFPNKPLFLALGVAAGVVLGLSAALIAEIFAAGIMSVGEVESQLGVPALAALPVVAPKLLRQSKGGPQAYAAAKPMSAFAEAFRTLRSALTLGGSANARAICITSALPGEGKSVASLAFARVLGFGGARVVVVDCDLRRSSLANLTRKSVDFGLLEVLRGEASLEQALVADDAPGVTLLALRGVSFSPEDVFGTDSFAALVAELRNRFDYVILDTPPVLAVADARTVAVAADAVVVLCRWARTPKSAAVAAVRLLQQDGANIAGAVLNMVDFEARRTLSAEDPAYHYRAYRRYYVG